MPGLPIKNLNQSDRPRERIISSGGSSLSDAELLALILRSGGRHISVLELAAKLLSDYGGFKGLAGTDLNQLINYSNIGIAKATSVKACIEIALRIFSQEEAKGSLITKPEDIFKIVKKDLYGKEQEHLYLISLDSRNRFISKSLISSGTINETLIHPREVFRKALVSGAVSIALAHNHPSGDPTPSQEDIKVTEKLAVAGSEIGVTILDHLVVSNLNYVSIKALNLFSTKLSGKGGENK